MAHDPVTGMHDSHILRSSAKYAKEKFGDKQLIIAEIGVREGQNTISMLLNMNIKMAYMIDSYEPYTDNLDDPQSQEYQDIWYKNMFYYMRSFLDKVTFITKSSAFASQLFEDNFFDYVYIDANHSYPSVYEDINLWYQKVKEGGILAGHDLDDVRFLGVKKAVEVFCDDNKINYVPLKEDWAIERK